ncbi:MAG: hypothetical protein J1E64_07195 [Acetatifactor sp.]|nr:hypothetical protein [Acetatifactor sp.]
METITFENIEVDGIPFRKITSLSIKHAVNEHGTCHIEGILWQWDAEQTIKRADEHSYFTITTSAEGQPSRLFCGVIQSIRMKKENDYAVVTVDGITSSGRLDTLRGSRTFQNTTQTYEELLSQLLEGRGTIEVTGQDKSVGSFIIKCDETDWEFIVRMASRLGVPACINIISEVPQIYIGIPHKGKTVRVDTSFVETGKALSNVVAGVQQVSVYEYAYLGDELQLNGKTYIIRSIQADLVDGLLDCRYCITVSNGFQVARVPNRQASGRMIKGKVEKVEKDRVQVSFPSIDASYDDKGDWWFPYATAYSSQDGSGWYSMPAQGDEVRVFFPSGDEGEAFAAGAVAKHARTNPTDKAWTGIGGKEILMTEEGLIITCKDQEIYIKLSDEGIEIFSNKNINVTSSANVNISAGNTVKIIAEEEVVLGTAQAHINIRQEGINATGQQIVLA